MEGPASRRRARGDRARALKALRDSAFSADTALDKDDYELKSVNLDGSWAVVACLTRKRDGRELVLKAMKCNYRDGDFETRFASEVAFQQRAAEQNLAPPILQYGWGSSAFFDAAGIRSALRPFGESGTGMLYILMGQWTSTLREWWNSASVDDKATVRALTYALYDQIAGLGLRLDDLSADNVMVRSKPTLRVCAIDFDPNMTLEDQGAQEVMRGGVELVFEALDLCR